MSKPTVKARYLVCGVIALLGSVFGGAAAAILTMTRSASATDDSTVTERSAELNPDHFVTIHDGDDSKIIKTNAITVREALERAKIIIAETDRIEPALTAEITENTNINIYRSRPVIVIDGPTRKYTWTSSYDSATIAADAGVTFYDGDEMRTRKNDNFLESGGMTTYEIIRNGGRTVTVDTAIPYEKEEVDDDDLEEGKEKVKQVGEDGVKTSVYRVNFVDGVEVSRELVSETVAKQPVKQITAVGTKTKEEDSPKKANRSIRPEWSTCAEYAKAAGVSESDLYDALTLIYHESGCRVDAQNKSSGAYGIPQALPGKKMAAYGDDWETNPVTQIKWMANYVKKRYGGWSQALGHWSSAGWY